MPSEVLGVGVVFPADLVAKGFAAALLGDNFDGNVGGVGVWRRWVSWCWLHRRCCRDLAWLDAVATHLVGGGRGRDCGRGWSRLLGRRQRVQRAVETESADVDVLDGARVMCLDAILELGELGDDFVWSGPGVDELLGHAGWARGVVLAIVQEDKLALAEGW